MPTGSTTTEEVGRQFPDHPVTGMDDVVCQVRYVHHRSIRREARRMSEGPPEFRPAEQEIARTRRKPFRGVRDQGTEDAATRSGA